MLVGKCGELMVKICTRCGISSEKRRFVGSFCSACAPIQVSMPDEIELAKCGRCGRVQVEKEWKEEGKVDLQGIVRKLCKGDIRNAEFDEQTGELSLIAEQSGAFVELKKKVEVKYQKALCIDCSRTAAGYFEAIIQVRGEKRERIEKKANEIAKAVLRKSFIPKIEELKEGIDIYCGSRNEAIAALNSLKLGYMRTEKLAGERDGKRLYRTTLAVRV